MGRYVEVWGRYGEIAHLVIDPVKARVHDGVMLPLSNEALLDAEREPDTWTAWGGERRRVPCDPPTGGIRRACHVATGW